MSDNMYSVWCEWDIGQEGLIFKSKQAAEDWIKEAWKMQMEDNGEDIGTLDEVYEDNLIGIQPLSVQG